MAKAKKEPGTEAAQGQPYRALCFLQAMPGSPYSPSWFLPEKPDGISHDAHEHNAWRERAHYDRDTLEVYIPAMAFQYALTDSAKYRGEKVKGSGNKTWTGYFTRAISIAGNVMLGVRRDDLKCQTFMMHATGQRTDGKRVPRIFPMVYDWTGLLDVHVLDPVITPAVLESTLDDCGRFNGVGRFSPRKNGNNGRFNVTKIEYQSLLAARAG